MINYLLEIVVFFIISICLVLITFKPTKANKKTIFGYSNIQNYQKIISFGSLFILYISVFNDYEDNTYQSLIIVFVMLFMSFLIFSPRRKHDK